MRWTPSDLSGRIAVVTGASRGVGKGIAAALGASGATVYVTGRSTRAAPAAGGRLGCVEDAAEEVTVRGGRGIPVVVDHTDDEAVHSLFQRVWTDERRLDLVVANAWGGYEEYDESFSAPFWEQPVSRLDSMLRAGLRSHMTTAREGARPMVREGRGVIVFTGGWDDPRFYLGSVPYDVVKAATDRLVVVTAHELRPYGVASVGIYPGFTRTEAVVAAYAAEGREPPAETHSPEFVGRAVTAVAGDPDVLDLSGTSAQAASYARRYGFTDVDGRRVEPFVMPAENRLQAPAGRPGRQGA